VPGTSRPRGWICAACWISSSRTSRRTVHKVGTSVRAFSHRVLSATKPCITWHEMKTAALTIRLDPELQRQLTRLARRTGKTRSELARDALRRQLALAQFED